MQITNPFLNLYVKYCKEIQKGNLFILHSVEGHLLAQLM